MRRVAALAALAALAATGVVVGIASSTAASAPRVASPTRVLSVNASPVALASQLPAESSAVVVTAATYAVFIPGRAQQTYTRLVVHSSVIPFGVFRHNDSSLYVGTTKIVQTGHTGVLRTVIRVTARNHRQTGMKVVRRYVYVAARAELVAVGTKARPVSRPRPAPVPSGRYPGVPTYVQQLNWAALARCESGGNPKSSDGTYFGLYQFSLGAWYSVGGTGLPTNASSYEQTYRAMLLYMARGAGPWPTCGVYL